MENITFLNLAAQSPSIELNFGLSEKIQRETNLPHTFFMCNAAFLSCSVNIDNKKSICAICKYKALKGYEHYKKRNPNSKLVKLNRRDILDNQFELKEKDKAQIMLGVNSTIGSQLRLDDMSILNNKWKKRQNNLFKSSLAQFHFFQNYLSINDVKNFLIFNGRLSCARPLILASKYNKVDFMLFDAALNGKTPMYSKNEMFHSIEFEKRNSLRTYLKHFKESNELANQYAFYKRNKIQVNDKVYTNDQVYGEIDSRIKYKEKEIISIFTSSDDEYKFIGIDWEKYGLEDQIESIKTLNKKLSGKYQVVVKMHPNQKYLHKSILDKYDKISNEILILFPENKTDSYELINKSEIIINFCSTVGIEANYFRKPVVQIGASRFRGLPAANYVKNANEAVKIILNKEYKVMPLRASIIYFTYLMKSSFKIESYNFLEDGIYQYGGKTLKAPFLFRILSVPYKVLYSLEKGNVDFIKNFGRYFKNLIFGRTKV